MAEHYQIYNPNNGCYVKMKAGRILANKPKASGPFEDVPMRQEKEESTEQQSSISSTEEQNNEGLATQEDDTFSGSFFEWD